MVSRTLRKRIKGRARSKDYRGCVKFVMEKSHRTIRLAANQAGGVPSFQEKELVNGPRTELGGIRGNLPGILLSLLGVVFCLTGCGEQAPGPGSTSPAETKSAEPAVPEEVQGAAEALLGSETQVLVFGDLAKTGKQQFLAANVVPKTPTNNALGTIVTRAVIAENNNGKWMELLRCDEYLKNEKGFLGLTPLNGVNGWRVQYEQDAEKGLQVYFTPLKVSGSVHVLPIGVRWNPATRRYQSLDRTYEHFLLEASSLENARSMLR
jgi:hypothetical protein